jgi:hydrogenase nickel incorporation protein HypA/HybF
MHEMGVVSGIITASVETAAREDAIRIKEIVIRVGVLTEILQDALDFAFEALAPGTLAEGATLTVNWVEPRSKCHQCGTTFTHGRFDVTCPECENPFCEPIEGRELLIDFIDIELPEEAVATEAEELR